MCSVSTPAVLFVGNTSYSLVGEVAAQLGVICAVSFVRRNVEQSVIAVTVGWLCPYRSPQLVEQRPHGGNWNLLVECSQEITSVRAQPVCLGLLQPFLGMFVMTYKQTPCNISKERRPQSADYYRMLFLEVMQSHYRPGQALWAARGWGCQNFETFGAWRR